MKYCVAKKPSLPLYFVSCPTVFFAFRKRKRGCRERAHAHFERKLVMWYFSVFGTMHPNADEKVFFEGVDLFPCNEPKLQQYIRSRSAARSRVVC